jgi:hypothetical protein
MNVLKRGKKRSTKSVSLYANLSNRRKANRDLKKRRKAEYLATLPKHPVKRLFYRLHPKRFFGYWFSKDGLLMMLKIFGVSMAVLALIIGILFLYYRRELDAIRPDEIAKRVQTTVTTYTDRNGVVLWEDKGDGDYKLVVKSDDISKHMKNATVAIEDKDFYKHGGFSERYCTRCLVQLYQQRLDPGWFNTNTTAHKTGVFCRRSRKSRLVWRAAQDQRSDFVYTSRGNL